MSHRSPLRELAPALLLALPPSSGALEIPLAVEETAGVARRGEPVTSGVPLPRGAFRADQAFALFDGMAEIPLQAHPLVVDRDGSLRWVLLDFQADLAAKGTKRLVLKTQPPAVRPAVAIQVDEDDDALAVDTGALRFAIAKTRPFALFDAVRVRTDPDMRGGAVEVVEAKTGLRLRAGAPKRVVLEYRGPLRVTARVEGAYEPVPGAPAGGGAAPRLAYITRVTAWSGRADVLVQHILANSNPEQVCHVNLAGATLAVPHGLGADAEAFLGAGGVSARLAEAAPAWLHRGKVGRATDACRAGAGEETTWTGPESGGWIAARAGGHAVLVVDRDFAGDPPRRLAADGARIAIEYVAATPGPGRGEPFLSDHFWLYDLSHKTAEARIDFAPVGDFNAIALAARARLRALAPPGWYAQCDVFGVGRFGTLEDEKAVYAQWGWAFADKQLPRSDPAPAAFVRWEDNHYESEADSAEALLLMAVRTGQRGFLDQGEAWARYHANLHAWRTDGWIYDDGAIWFPQGGPLGTKPARKPPALKYQHWNKGTGDDRELWRLVQAKACYCHFYGAGLVDWFLLTGERDALEAAIDLAEQKDSEYRKHRQLSPGKSTIDDTRGFGRGFYVVTHLLEAVPDDAFVADLARLCRDVLARCPNLDERGFAPCHIGTGFGGFDLKKDIPPEMRAFMEKEGIAIDAKGVLTDKTGARWPVVCLGGTWQHAYVQAAADRYARLFGDEDLADFSEAFGRFAAKHLLSEKCRQTHYYAYMDVPRKGEAWDPWRFEAAHAATTDGAGCVHSGWYTRFFPDAIATAYSLSGGPPLLERARDFWHYGSKREYQSKEYSAGPDAVGAFATHVPPKDDSVLSTSRLFYEWAHPRKDAQPPKTVRDLAVSDVGEGKATVRFTAPADAGGGNVSRYQVKCAELPIVAYDDYDFARDDGAKRSWWRAANVQGEPTPKGPGEREAFVVTGVPDAKVLHVVVAAYDDSGNRGGLSNGVRVETGAR